MIFISNFWHLHRHLGTLSQVYAQRQAIKSFIKTPKSESSKHDQKLDLANWLDFEFCDFDDSSVF